MICNFHHEIVVDTSTKFISAGIALPGTTIDYPVLGESISSFRYVGLCTRYMISGTVASKMRSTDGTCEEYYNFLF